VHPIWDSVVVVTEVCNPRVRRLVCVAVCGASGLAGAETLDYPETSVDRPLVMYGGMTSLDVSEDFYTYTQTGVDGNGKGRRLPGQ
jgi:hypothetical protein